MNGLSAQASPSRRPKNVRGGGTGDGNRPARATTTGVRPRGRGRGSKLVSSSRSMTPNHLTSSPSGIAIFQNGDETATESESADESGPPSRQERFNKIDPGNQYEQVPPH
jgi:hypothetical protein